MIDLQLGQITPQLKPSTASPERKQALMEQAKEFETVFVTQMLQYSGLADAVSGDSGNGGDAFSGMLVEQYANDLVESGGFGIAEKIYAQLLDKEVDVDTNTAT